jgi:hypothetical protein
MTHVPLKSGFAERATETLKLKAESKTIKTIILRFMRCLSFELKPQNSLEPKQKALSS